MNPFYLFITIFITFNSWANIENGHTIAPTFLEECSSTKEYMTTYNFLKGHTEFKIAPMEQTRIADIISQNCSGASLRFIKVTNLLIKAGLDTSNSMNSALKFIATDDQTTETFINIFREAFLAKGLDLDLLTAHKLAISLSSEFNGQPKNAQEDFSALVKFCVSEDGVNLPRPTCAQFAARITKLGERFANPVAKPFINLVYFLSDKKNGPHRPMFKAMKLAENIISNGPMAYENFSQAYKFASAKKGLDLPDDQALSFASNMAARTIANKDKKENIK